MKRPFKTLIATALLVATTMIAQPAMAHDSDDDAYIPTFLYATDATPYYSQQSSTVYYYTTSPAGFYVRETRLMPPPPPRIIYVQPKPVKYHHGRSNHGHGHGKDRHR